jgi:oligopeptide/dipeptide ABC transporter ATP-binding protein
MQIKDILVEVRQLNKYFPINPGIFRRTKDHIKAVDGVDLQIRRGETMGLVGESGCGKTTLGSLILRLDEPTSGKIYFEGKNILDYDGNALRRLRLDMQIVFQDPYASLNPRQTVGSIIQEPLIVHKIADRKQSQKRAQRLMEIVGLRPEHYHNYPHEFSGGQRQRIGIARALALNPKLIICDEPVSALDVSIQAQIINLLVSLQREFGLTLLFISHDLSVVGHICDRVSVMYLGRIVELGKSKELFERPYHPYSEALISACPIPEPGRSRTRIILKGEIPSPISPPSGCHFHPRCPHAIEKCGLEPPPSIEEITPEHWVRCWRVKEIRGIP